MNKHMINDLERNIALEENALKKHGWNFVEDSKGGHWEDPEGKIHKCNEAYDHLIGRILKEKGWRDFTQIIHSNKEEKWVRYQSPVTKRVYTYFDAEYIATNNWDENHYPEGCCGATTLLNNLLGDNFTAEEVHTQYCRENGELVLKFWSE